MMSNYYEYRLHQIELLLRAYTTNGEGNHEKEIEELKEERNLILDELINERLLTE